jgi:3-oxoacyl-[acyl-carrier-protein] synthase II
MEGSERVVITGIGAISPIGHTAEASWQSVIKGVSGVGPITQFDTNDYLVKIACEVKDFLPEAFMPGKEARRRDRFEQLASAAVVEALSQSGLNAHAGNAGRIGVIVSSAIGGLNVLEENIPLIRAEGPRKISPFAIPKLMANGAAGLIGIDYGFQGPSFSIGSACASGADGIGIAWTLIRTGVIDAAVTGASESTITPIGVAAFDRIGATSRRNDDYSMTPQPFDKNRDGLVMGEGAAILVLESERHARQRGASILAELAGYASTADAHHITAPAEDGSGGAQAIRLALASAGLNLGDVDYVNAHGTGTVLNDLAETRAIKAAFGDLAYRVPISSTKSMTGHMMGATGALEAVFCVFAVRENIMPPTIHYETPDSECDLDYIPNQARSKIVRVAISNSFGFGGHNAVLVIKKYV